MTTNVFASFSAFCEQESLPSDTVRDLFRGDEASRDLLVGLEEGTLGDAEFERRHSARRSDERIISVQIERGERQ